MFMYHYVLHDRSRINKIGINTSEIPYRITFLFPHIDNITNTVLKYANLCKFTLLLNAHILIG